MAEQNIQIKNNNGTTWDNLFPKTKAVIVERDNGETVEQSLSSMQLKKMDKTGTYTKLEIDAKIADSEGTIPVSPTEPIESELWFEEIV